MQRTVKGSAPYKLADRQLAELLKGHDRVRLGEMARELSRVDDVRYMGREGKEEPPLANRVSIDLVSRLLRAQGFRKTGQEGIGYDREPVYERAAL